MKRKTLALIVPLVLVASACSSAPTGDVGPPESLKEHAAEETARMEEAGAGYKAEGDAFLAENANKPGVVVLDSGLQYEVLTKGEGPSPMLSDQITAHYEGHLIDGQS
ncbi:MAG: hypothetical protein IH849_14535 [Acidobacteria bacterium]|nr:hypothetical protein [Acidobacteriota bacterium]